MAKRHSYVDLRRWAVVGAEQRLLQIAQEAATIFQVFPELRNRGFMADDAGQAPARSGRRAQTAPPARGIRRRRKISAAGRKRISEAQKARWAKQKKAAKR